jgi:hypothetical protein
MTVPSTIADKAKDFVGRTWVADEVAAWIANGTERFFAITGAPGTGKSALAAWLAGAGPEPKAKGDAATLKRVRKAWAATHFCVRGGSTNAVDFGSSIAGQLARRLDDFLPAVARANDRSFTSNINVRGDNKGTIVAMKIQELVIEVSGRAESSAAVTAIWHNAVRKPLQELADSNPKLGAFILVDALDEAADVPRPNIVSLLRDSDDLPPGVRFLVTMSTELDASALFPGARVVDLSSAATNANSNDDVRAYVRAELAPSKAAEDRLVAAADGNFLYVRFLAQEIGKGVRSLDDVEALPVGLSPLYSEYLDRLTGTEPGQPPRPKWKRELQPLVGCISVATPSAPDDLLPLWLGKDAGKVSLVLTEARQLTEEDDSPDGFGYRLYHRSMGDFLAAPRYGGNGSVKKNRYHTPPATQHERIATHYLNDFATDWGAADSYGLRHVVGHLAATAAAETAPEKRRRRTATVYDLVLDPTFQAAQKEKLGNLHPTLADLRLAIDTALSGDEVVPLLRCVAGFRGAARSGAIAQGIFTAVERGDLSTAIADAEHYGPPPRPRGRWARVLNAWIAWQAARRNDPKAARQAADGVVSQWTASGSEAEPLYWELCRALIVRSAKALLANGTDPGQLLRVFPDEYAALANEVAKRPARRPSDAQTAKLLEELSGRLKEFEDLLETDPYEAVETPWANAEGQAWQARTMRDLLIGLAGRPEGRDGIERTLGPTLGNPYARYRDIGLVALGTAVVAVPDDDWADRKLRAILLAGLDAEGVTFTFDLPTLVLGEIRHRGREDARLADYLSHAHTSADEKDRWTTGIRALNADAAAIFVRGNADGAMATLIDASRRRPGFAGYTSAAYMALASRCLQFGRGDVIGQAIWGPDANRSLDNLTRDAAGRIMDLDFRAERGALVERYASWLKEPQPDIRAIHEFIGVTPDPDSRRTYKELASARWAAANTPDARTWLKALVPMVLEDTTTLDAMLARVLGPHLSAMPDSELKTIADLVADRFTTGRPWDMGVPLKRPIAW